MDNSSPNNLKTRSTKLQTEFFVYDRLPAIIKKELQNAPIDISAVDCKQLLGKYHPFTIVQIIRRTIRELEPLVK